MSILEPCFPEYEISRPARAEGNRVLYGLLFESEKNVSFSENTHLTPPLIVQRGTVIKTSQFYQEKLKEIMKIRPWQIYLNSLRT